MNIDLSINNKSTKEDNKYSVVVGPAILTQFLDLYGREGLTALGYNKTRIDRMLDKGLQASEIDTIYVAMKSGLKLNYLLPEWEFQIYQMIRKFAGPSMIWAHMYGVRTKTQLLSYMNNKKSYNYIAQNHSYFMDRRKLYNAYLFFLLDLFKYTKFLNRTDFVKVLRQHVPYNNEHYIDFMKPYRTMRKYMRWHYASVDEPITKAFNYDNFILLIKKIQSIYKYHGIHNIQQYLLDNHTRYSDGKYYDFSEPNITITKNPAIYYLKYYLPSTLPVNEQKLLKTLF